MDAKKIYSIGGLFDTPDSITHAAEAAVKEGYTKFDVNTPYPVHGMERAMKLKPSLIGYATLFIGLSGAAFAFLFMYWVSVMDYPLIIGGKPFFSWPAFVPITFEVTVLSAAVGTVAVLIALFFKFPNNAHPLHDTNYMKNVSSDKFGLNVAVIDPLFDENKIREFLSREGAHDIEVFYEPEKKPVNVFDKRFLGLLVVVAIVTAGVTYFTLNKLIYMQPFTWMGVQDRLSAQSQNVMFDDGFGMRTPVEGTVARGFTPYEFKGQPDSVVKNMSNPLPFTKEVIEKGKSRFDTYCSPCHGYYGKGDSRLNGQFPNPPTLHSDKVRNWSDGNIYHVITNGQNVMPSYAKQISRDDRWAIIHYIRVLQRSLNAKDTDLETKK
ncbi:MAG: DUF3341 domain-containing protein [Bacteroidetes bacterium]|nr:DUF3341 domain-containing protein [Bacteroidota bacterium]